MDNQEDEAYSPSRSFTPPPAAIESIPFLDNQALPDIALPSNLQEILASIKKQPEPTKGLTLKLDPIVQAYSKSEEPYSPEDKPEPPVINDVDDFTLASVTPPDIISAQPTPAPVKINRDPRQRGDAKSLRTSLSQLSDEDLIRKAAEMGFMNPENPETTLSNESTGKSLVDQPPPPGLEDEYHDFDTVQKPVKSVPVSSGPGPPMMSSSAPSYPPPAAPYSAPPYGSYPPMYPPPNFSSQSVYQQSQHIPFTNPQPPPPPQPVYQPPPPQPPPPQPQPLPPPPKESTLPAKKEHNLMTRKLKKTNMIPSGDKSRATRKFSEQLKNYDNGKETLRKREKFLDKRGRRQNWQPVDKRKDSWDYEQPPHPPPTLPSSSSSMRGVMRGRYPHPQRGFPMRRGFDHSNRGGYHRGFHRQRGHPMGPPRGGYPPKHHSGIQNEWDETIRHFEVKHRERNNKLKRRIERERRWRGGSSPPRKKRSKDSDSEG